MTIAVVGSVVAGILVSIGWWWPAAGAALVTLALLAFFRDPRRRVPAAPPGAMLSPADGKVVAVDRVEVPPVGGPAVVIRIFLSIFDVHVNRAPCAGRVVGLEYRRGRFHDARSHHSTAENECNLISLQTSGGEVVGIRQIAGKIARRIVCDLRVGEHLEQGRRFGMIKFGSGTELILPRPDEVEVHVRVGDRVAAGLTTLATLSGSPAATP